MYFYSAAVRANNGCHKVDSFFIIHTHTHEYSNSTPLFSGRKVSGDAEAGA